MMSVPRSPTPVKTEPAVSDRWKLIDSIYKWANVPLDDATECTIDRTCLACVKEMTENPLHVCADSTTNTNTTSCIHCLQNSAACETITGDQQDAIYQFITICHNLRSDRANTNGALEPEALANLIRDYEAQCSEISQLLESIPHEARIERADSQAPARAQLSPASDPEELTEKIRGLKRKVRMLRTRMKTLKRMVKGLETTITDIHTDQRLTMERTEDVYKLVIAQSAQIAALSLSNQSTGQGGVSSEHTRPSSMVTQPFIKPSVEPSAPASAFPEVTQPSIEPSAPAAQPENSDMEDIQRDNLTDCEPPPEDSKKIGKPDLILKKIIPRIHEDIDKMVPGGLLHAQLTENLKVVVKYEYLDGVGNLNHAGDINYENIRLTRGAFLYAFDRWCKMSRQQRNQFYEYYSAASNNRERRYVVAYFQSDAIFSDGTKIHTLPNTGPPKIEDTRYSFPANWYFHDMYHLPEHPAQKSYGPEDIARSAGRNDSSHLDRQIIGVMHNSERYEEALAKFRKYRTMPSARQREFRDVFWQGTPSERFILLEGLIYNIDMTKTTGWRGLATKEHEARFAMCYPRHPHLPGVDVNPRVAILAQCGQKRGYSEVDGNGN